MPFSQFCGWVNDPVAVNKVSQAQPHPTWASAASMYGTQGLGAGKRTLLYPMLYKALGGKANYVPRLQTIGDCVSHGAANAVDILRAIQTATGKGQWLAETASEVIYALSRVEIGHGQLGSGDGSVGAWAAEACRTYGTLLRQVYGKYDLTKYDGNRAKSWGMPNAGLPNDLEPAAHEHLVRSVTLVKTWEDLCDAIAAGYPVTVASNQGFTSTRDSEGFAGPSGTWGHQMVFWAADDLSPRKGALIENSWGSNWITGPTTYDQPPGSFWADKSVVEHMLAMQDSWAYSDYEGFPPKQLDLGDIF